MEPWFDDLRTDPRFADLIKRLNFSDPPGVDPKKPSYSQASLLPAIRVKHTINPKLFAVSFDL